MQIAFLLTQICHRKIRQHIDKASFCLCDKGSAVCKKQNIFHPAVLQKHIAKCNDCPCLSRSGRHDKQCFSSVLFIKALAYCLDRLFLIIPSGDFFINPDTAKIAPHGF